MTTITNVNRGTTPGDGTGDTAYDAFGKVNTNDNNLNTDKLERDGSIPLTANWDVGSFSLTMASLNTDTINEETAAAGVTVDGVLIKDGAIGWAYIGDVTASAAEVNLLDLSGLTAGWVLSADTATTASWQALNFTDLGTTPTTLAGYGISDSTTNFNTALTGADFVFTNTSFSGDVTGTYNATVVGDDTHNHSLSTISDASSITLDYVTGNGDTTTNNVNASSIFAGDPGLTSDGQFFMGALSATVPQLQFDVGDRIQYDRGSNQFEFEISNVDQMVLNGSSVDFQNNDVKTTGDFYSSVNNSSVTYGGGDTGFAGANIVLQGGASSSAYDILFRSDTTIEMEFDYSLNGGTFDFRANHITTTETITGATVAGTTVTQGGNNVLDTSTSFSGDVSGTYNTIVVANDSHTHTFDNLTSKASGTGDYKTSGDFVAGEGSGGIGLTINDGYGNSNLTFNHQNGTPDNISATQSAYRIEASTDNNTASMSFEMGNSTTQGVPVGLTQIMAMSTSAIDCQVNLDANAGLDVTGNITVTGTVDGVDLQTVPILANTTANTDYLYLNRNNASNPVVHIQQQGAGPIALFKQGATAGSGTTVCTIDNSGGITAGRGVFNSGATNNCLSLESTDATVTLTMKDSTTSATANWDVALSRAGDILSIWSQGAQQATVSGTTWNFQNNNLTTTSGTVTAATLNLGDTNLSNYEEGAVSGVTLTNTSDTNVGAGDYSVSGQYTRVGDLVHVSIKIIITTKDNAAVAESDNMRIRGLPFNNANDYGSALQVFINGIGFTTTSTGIQASDRDEGYGINAANQNVMASPKGLINGTSTDVDLYVANSAAGFGRMKWANFGDNGTVSVSLRLEGTYHTDDA